MVAGAAMRKSPPDAVTGQIRSAAGPGAGPTNVENAVPIGYSRTTAGAAVAAENFLRAGSGTLVADKAKYLAAMSTMATPKWKPRAIETGRNAVAFFQDRYGSRGTLLTAPLAVDVVELEHKRARVKIWSVSVASGSKQPGGEQVWGVTTFDLKWISGDWRVARETTRGSPAAVLLEGQRLGPVASLMDKFDRDD